MILYQVYIFEQKIPRFIRRKEDQSDERSRQMQRRYVLQCSLVCIDLMCIKEVLHHFISSPELLQIKELSIFTNSSRIVQVFVDQVSDC